MTSPIVSSQPRPLSPRIPQPCPGRKKPPPEPRKRKRRRKRPCRSNNHERETVRTQTDPWNQNCADGPVRDFRSGRCVLFFQVIRSTHAPPPRLSRPGYDRPAAAVEVRVELRREGDALGGEV